MDKLDFIKRTVENKDNTDKEVPIEFIQIDKPFSFPSFIF